MVIPWVGYPLSELIKRVEPTGKAKYVEFVTLADPEQMPGVAPSAGVALRRRPAHGRSHAPADDPVRRACTAKCCRIRTARRCAWWCRGSTGSRAASRSSRSASPSSSPRPPGTLAKPQRVRLLLQRQSGGRPSALEPGQGAAHRRVRQAPDADVQRLRRPGRVAVRRHGSEEELLKATEPRRTRETTDEGKNRTDWIVRMTIGTMHAVHRGSDCHALAVFARCCFSPCLRVLRGQS